MQSFKTIYHVCGPCRNYGDIAIQRSMEEHLQQQSPYPLNFVTIDCKMENRITSSLVDLINETGSMVIVGGGGFVMKGDGFATDSGWQFNISYGNLTKLKVPLVCYGIGFNVFPGDNEHENEAMRHHLMLTQSLSELFSVRDHGSKRALMCLGLKDMEVIPDPASFAPSFPIQSGALDDQNLLIGVNIAGDRLQNRFSTGDWTDVELELDQLAAVLGYFLEGRGGGKVVYFPHVEKYDKKAVSILRLGLGSQFVSIDELFPELFPENPAYFPIFNGLYSKMNAVLGMRGHSLILSYSNNVPMIGYGKHDKVSFFCEEVGAYFQKSYSPHLINSLESAIFDQSYKQRLQTKHRADFKVFQNFNKRVLELL